MNDKLNKDDIKRIKELEEKIKDYDYMIRNDKNGIKELEKYQTACIHKIYEINHKLFYENYKDKVDNGVE